MEAIFIIGTAQAFFFEFLLLRKRNKSTSDIVLAVWMFVIGLHLFSAYGRTIDLHLDFPFLIVFFSPFPLLHGPFLLLYVLGLIREGRKIYFGDYLHFIPFILGMCVFLPYINLSGDQFLAAMNELEAGGPQTWPFILFGVGLQFSGLIYAIVSYFLLNGHKKRIKNQFSFQEEVSLNWLRYNILAIGCIYIVVIISILLQERFGLLSQPAGENIIFTTVTIFVFLFGYFGIRQEGIFTDTAPDSSGKDALTQAVAAERYHRSGLKEEDISHYYLKLLEVMDKKEPFLQNKLTLKELAETLDLSQNHLSQIINEKAGQNFYQFVNSYRVKAFQEKIHDPSNQHFSILALALDCGFNSKSSFNNIFKKFTGMTPSEYQKVQQSEKVN